MVVVACGARAQPLLADKARLAVEQIKQREGPGTRVTLLQGGLAGLVQHTEGHPAGSHRVVFLVVDAADPEAAAELEQAPRLT